MRIFPHCIWYEARDGKCIVFHYVYSMRFSLCIFFIICVIMSIYSMCFSLCILCLLFHYVDFHYLDFHYIDFQCF